MVETCAVTQSCQRRSEDDGIYSLLLAGPNGFGSEVGT